MPEEPAHLVGVPKVCPRCQSSTLKFLFYNNRSVHQPRYKCLGCSKDFTLGGRIRRSNLQQAQQQQQQPIGRNIRVQGTVIGGAEGEVGPSDRTPLSGIDRNAGGIGVQGTIGGARGEGEVGPSDRPLLRGIDRNAGGGDVRSSDSLEPTASEQQLVQESNVAQDFGEAAIPHDGERGVVVQVEVRQISGAFVKPVAIPRYGDKVIVEGASNIWVKAVLGSAPYDLARVRAPNPKDKNTRTSGMESRGTELR